MANVLKCGLKVSEFKLQSCNYVYFRTDNLGGWWNPLSPPSYGLNTITTVLLQSWIWNKITHRGWCAIKQRNQMLLMLITLHFCCCCCCFFLLLFQILHVSKEINITCVRTPMRQMFQLCKLSSWKNCGVISVWEVAMLFPYSIDTSVVFNLVIIHNWTKKLNPFLLLPKI